MAGSAGIPIPYEDRADARKRLIVALDVSDVDKAKATVQELDEEVVFYKIGWHLLLDPGFHNLVEQLKQEDKNIFLDLKVFDIPATVEGAVRAACALGVKFITIAGQREIIKAAVKARLNSTLRILVVTLLTYLNQEDLKQEYGTEKKLEDFIRDRAGFAADCGCDGVISSAREARLIRDVVNRRDFVVVTPGIRPKDAAADDQKRVATPYQAIRNGADYLVVGRPIVQHARKRDAARAILNEMQAAIDEGGAGPEAGRRAYA